MGRLTSALIVMLLPSVVVSAYLVAAGPLETMKNSPFGGYVRRHLTPLATMLRIVGLIVDWARGSTNGSPYSAEMQ